MRDLLCQAAWFEVESAVSLSLFLATIEGGGAMSVHRNVRSMYDRGLSQQLMKEVFDREMSKKMRKVYLKHGGKVD